jgi:hypothetical protein
MAAGVSFIRWFGHSRYLQTGVLEDAATFLSHENFFWPRLDALQWLPMRFVSHQTNVRSYVYRPFNSLIEP